MRPAVVFYVAPRAITMLGAQSPLRHLRLHGAASTAQLLPLQHRPQIASMLFPISELAIPHPFASLATVAAPITADSALITAARLVF